MNSINSVDLSSKAVTLKVGNWYHSDILENKGKEWHSDNPNVASVNPSNGYIYGNAKGTTIIRSTAVDGSSESLVVTVSDTIQITSVILDHTTLRIEKDHNVNLTATVLPDNASNKELIWTSSDIGVATVDNGIVTPVSLGTATITVTAIDGSGMSASCTISVTDDILVSSICILQNEGTLITNKSVYLKATICPTNATNRCVTWSSDDASIATVNPASGLVYAEKAGNTGN